MSDDENRRPSPVSTPVGTMLSTPNKNKIPSLPSTPSTSATRAAAVRKRSSSARRRRSASRSRASSRSRPRSGDAGGSTSSPSVASASPASTTQSTPVHRNGRVTTDQQQKKPPTEKDRTRSTVKNEVESPPKIISATKKKTREIVPPSDDDKTVTTLETSSTGGRSTKSSKKSRRRSSNANTPRIPTSVAAAQSFSPVVVGTPPPPPPGLPPDPPGGSAQPLFRIGSSSPSKVLPTKKSPSPGKKKIKERAKKRVEKEKKGQIMKQQRQQLKVVNSPTPADAKKEAELDRLVADTFDIMPTKETSPLSASSPEGKKCRVADKDTDTSTDVDINAADNNNSIGNTTINQGENKPSSNSTPNVDDGDQKQEKNTSDNTEKSSIDNNKKVLQVEEQKKEEDEEDGHDDEEELTGYLDDILRVADDNKIIRPGAAADNSGSRSSLNRSGGPVDLDESVHDDEDSTIAPPPVDLDDTVQDEDSDDDDDFDEIMKDKENTEAGAANDNKQMAAKEKETAVKMNNTNKAETATDTGKKKADDEAFTLQPSTKAHNNAASLPIKPIPPPRQHPSPGAFSINTAGTTASPTPISISASSPRASMIASSGDAMKKRLRSRIEKNRQQVHLGEQQALPAPLPPPIKKVPSAKDFDVDNKAVAITGDTKEVVLLPPPLKKVLPAKDNHNKPMAAECTNNAVTAEDTKEVVLLPPPLKKVLSAKNFDNKSMHTEVAAMKTEAAVQPIKKPDFLLVKHAEEDKKKEETAETKDEIRAQAEPPKDAQMKPEITIKPMGTITEEDTTEKEIDDSKDKIQEGQVEPPKDSKAPIVGENIQGKNAVEEKKGDATVTPPPPKRKLSSELRIDVGNVEGATEQPNLVIVAAASPKASELIQHFELQTAPKTSPSTGRVIPPPSPRSANKAGSLLSGGGGDATSAMKTPPRHPPSRGGHGPHTAYDHPQRSKSPKWANSLSQSIAMGEGGSGSAGDTRTDTDRMLLEFKKMELRMESRMLRMEKHFEKQLKTRMQYVEDKMDERMDEIQAMLQVILSKEISCKSISEI